MTNQDHSPDGTFKDLVSQAKAPILEPDRYTLERTLLAGAVASPEAAGLMVGQTQPEDFTFPQIQAIAGLILPRLVAGEHVDDLIVRRDLEATSEEFGEDVLDFIDEVFHQAQSDPPTLGKVESYLTIFIPAAKLNAARRVFDSAYRLIDQAHSMPGDGLAWAIGKLLDLDVTRRLVGRVRSEADDWPSYMAALRERQTEADFLGLDTGFSHLNNVINGLEAGTLIVIGAKPSLGKTTWAKQLVDQVATRNPQAACIFFSLEQAKHELRVKTLSRLSGIENRDILRGRLGRVTQGWEKVEEAAGRNDQDTGGRVFVIEGDKTTTVDRMRMTALQVKRLTESEGLLIVVDYLQIVPSPDDQEARQKVDETVSDLKRLARDLGATVLAISAINRASYDRTGDILDAFKESGGIEYGADVGGLLLATKDHNGDYETGEETLAGQTRRYKGVSLQIVKNRNGERAKINFKFFPAVSFFSEVGKEAVEDEDF